MFEIYLSNRDVFDPYMVIIENPDAELPGHLPYYEVTISPDGSLQHGAQWMTTEVLNLRARAAKDYSNSGASYAFKRVKAADAPDAVLVAIAKELEADNEQ